MVWLIEWLDGMALSGFSALEWVGIGCLIFLIMTGVLFAIRRLAGYWLSPKSARRPTGTARMADRLPGGHEKILIVDDEPSIRDSTARILHELGYQTVSVASGDEAVRYMEENGADLILMDLRMEPGMDGVETFRRIREIRPLQKAIVMTAYAGPAEITAVRALGIQHYLIKPAPLTLLARAIREEINRP
jgi:CheY-like chemotaxis protein